MIKIAQVLMTDGKTEEMTFGSAAAVGSQTFALMEACRLHFQSLGIGQPRVSTLRIYWLGHVVAAERVPVSDCGDLGLTLGDGAGAP